MTCTVTDCERPIRVHKRGLCNAHYQRWAKYGDVEMRFGGNRTCLGQEPGERFWAKVDRSGECWLWTGNVYRDGYGQFYVERRQVRAHRWAYESEVGPIPEGLVLDHLCRVRLCVRPSHLEPVTNRENLLRGIAARKGA